MNQVNIQALVKKYIGIPYKLMGRDLNGLDCLGLMYRFYQDCGIKIPDRDGSDYTNDWVKEDPDRYLRGLLKIGKAAQIDDLRPLDLVYFKIGKYISHGGVMIDNYNFIHVIQETKVHVSQMNNAWNRRLIGVRRLV